MKRILATLVVAASSFFLTSCGGGAKNHYPVKGKVLCDGEPAEGVDVVFHLKGDSDPDPHLPRGICDEHGVFTLECKDGVGAPPGDYYVDIRWLDYQSPEGKKHRGKNTVRFKNYPEDVLKGKYSNPTKPSIFATIAPTSNDLPPFEISRKGIEKNYLSSK